MHNHQHGVGSGSGVGHGAGHSHADATTNRKRLVIALIVTSTILVVEIVGAVITGSLALLVDAGHMLTDVVGLGMALTAAHLATRPATDQRTWGLKRAEILGALAQAVLLFGVGMYALVEGVKRFLNPPEINSDLLLLFGVIGLAANIISLVVLMGGRKNNLNMRAAFLEVLNDALGSVGVIAGAIAISVWGFYQADALVGILIALLIIPRTFVIMRESGRVLLESTPPGLDLAQVREHLLELPHVLEVHDLHSSLIDSNTPILSAHITVADECFVDGHAAEILTQLQECVVEHFAIPIPHTTFQIEPVSLKETDHCER